VAELSIGIAGLRAAVVTPDAKVAGVVRDRFKGFASSGPADWRVEISLPPESVPSYEDVVVKPDGVRRGLVAELRNRHEVGLERIDEAL